MARLCRTYPCCCRSIAQPFRQVEYVQRALEISLPCLAPLLHMALLVLPVVVVGDEQQALDICRFYNATSIHQTLQQSALDDSKVLKLPCTYAGESLPSESPAKYAIFLAICLCFVPATLTPFRCAALPLFICPREPSRG